MSEGIGYDPKEYGESKRLPFREFVEKYTLFELAGDVSGLTVLDAGCGEGVYVRELINRNASKVIGVDGDPAFIELARDKTSHLGDRVEFHHSLIQHFTGNENKGLVIGSYILSYPKSLREATEYCRAIASHLREGGTFVGFNNNPFEVFDGARYSEYGCEKEMRGACEGSEILWRVEGLSDPIRNFYLSPETYEKAFREAGFSTFEWKKVLLHPSEKDNDYWKEFFDGETPFIAMSAIK